MWLKYAPDPLPLPIQVKQSAWDTSQLINTQHKVVRSVTDTDEVAWHWGRGVFRVNAPKAQGVVGFVGQVGAFALGNGTAAGRATTRTCSSWCWTI